jgi:hypothetical protein
MTDEDLEREFLVWWNETAPVRNKDQDFTDMEALWKVARRFKEKK